jgi:hypothetical protein
MHHLCSVGCRTFEDSVTELTIASICYDYSILGVSMHLVL